jgi:hypothetical protein
MRCNLIPQEADQGVGNPHATQHVGKAHSALLRVTQTTNKPARRTGIREAIDCQDEMLCPGMLKIHPERGVLTTTPCNITPRGDATLMLKTETTWSRAATPRDTDIIYYGVLSEISRLSLLDRPDRNGVVALCSFPPPLNVHPQAIDGKDKDSEGNRNSPEERKLRPCRNPETIRRTGIIPIKERGGEEGGNEASGEEEHGY